MTCCESYATLLSAYLDGECTPEETAQVREHLKTCPGCRAYLQELSLLHDNFPDNQNIQVPPGMADGIMAAIRCRAVLQKHKRVTWRKALIPLAACLAIVLAIQFLPYCNSTASRAPIIISPSEKNSDQRASSSKQKTTESASSQKENKKSAKSNNTFGSSQKSAITSSAPPDESTQEENVENNHLDDTTNLPSKNAIEDNLSKSSNETGSTTALSYAKWISVSSDASDLLSNYSGVQDVDPVSGSAAIRYEMSTADFNVIIAKLSNVIIHTNDSVDSSLCCVYVVCGT